jgi:hypothetical protein
MSTAGSDGVGGVDSLVMDGIRRDDADPDGGGKAKGQGGAHVARGGRPRVRAATARQRPGGLRQPGEGGGRRCLGRGCRWLWGGVGGE